MASKSTTVGHGQRRLHAGITLVLHPHTSHDGPQLMAHTGIDVDAIRRRLTRRLGRRGRGKFAAIDRRTGEYILADDLNGLATALSKSRSTRFHIVRLGYRAAIELRGCL